MTSLGHRMGGGSRETSLRKGSIGGKTQHPTGHTRYIQHIEPKVKQLLMILTALEDKNISPEKCFKASGMRNRKVFDQLGNNQKYRLLMTCRTLTESIVSTKQPKALTQQDGLRLQRMQRQIEALHTYSPAVQSLISQVKLSISSYNNFPQ